MTMLDNTQDNAIADPTEQAPAADAVSETGRKVYSICGGRGVR